MLNVAADLSPELRAHRRHLHSCPELGFREFESSAYIAAQLSALGFEPRSIAGTGVIVDIRRGAGPMVLVRADMDALPIQEDTGLEFASKNSGRMHACGHDAHCAMVLGAAKILKYQDFSGAARIFFQPAEEGNYDDPDGYSGADRAIAEGLLDGVDCALAIHQIPSFRSGALSLRSGAVFAAADFFRIRIRGRAAHAGMAPQNGLDSIVGAASLISSLQTVVSRNLAPGEAGVLSVTKIEGGVAPNIIAESVEMLGTIRALSQAARELIHERVRALCASLKPAFNLEAEFEVTHSVPVTRNDEKALAIVRDSALKALGAAALEELPPILAGEDFGSISLKVPSVLALLGTRCGEGPETQLHNPRMRLDESALPTGAAWFAQSVIDLCENWT